METEVELGKIFIGGLSRNATEETLKEHFEAYGELEECLVIRHKRTRVCRGFGFVAFSDPSVALQVLEQQHHVILGKQVEVKQAIPMSKMPPPQEHQQQDTGVSGGAGHSEGKKIFIGGLHPESTEEELKTYFESFGSIKDLIVLRNEEGNSRCFAFITFDSEDAVTSLLRNRYHVLRSKKVEVKRAFPKERDSGIRNKPLDHWNGSIWFSRPWIQQPLPPIGTLYSGFMQPFPPFSYFFPMNSYEVASYGLPYNYGQWWFGTAPSGTFMHDFGPVSNPVYINGDHYMEDHGGSSDYRDMVSSEYEDMDDDAWSDYQGTVIAEYEGIEDDAGSDYQDTVTTEYKKEVSDADYVLSLLQDVQPLTEKNDPVNHKAGGKHRRCYSF